MQDWFLASNGNFTVSIMLDAVKFLLIYRYLQNIYWFKRGTIAHCRNRGCGRDLFSMQQTIAHACREVYCEKHTLPHATYKGRAWGAYTMIPKYAWAVMYRVPYWILKLPHFYFKTTFNTLIHWESSQLMGISTSSNSICKIKHYFRQQYFLS